MIKNNMIRISLFLNFIFCQVFIGDCFLASKPYEKYYLKTDIINVGDYSLKIVTKIIKDSLLQDEYNEMPKCISQDVFCYFKDSLIRQCDYKVHTIKKMVHGKKMIILENIIQQIEVIKNKNDFLYSISGYSSLNSGSEIYTLYSKEGIKKYFFYQKESIGKVYENYGDMTEIVAKYDIPIENFFCSKFVEKKIDYEFLVVR